MSVIRKQFNYGDHVVTLETGQIARQATGAVMVKMADTAVLVTVVAVSDEKAVERDFFPLTVNYQERTYAAGRIPGGYFKREGRPTEKEILTSRLIDRPLRPLFPKEFTTEVQVIATVMSVNPDINADIPAMIGASAALAVSGLPVTATMGAARVGYVDGKWVVNPRNEQLVKSHLDLVVAGTANAVLMVESEAKELSEAAMLEAVLFGHQQMQIAIQAINEFAAEANVTKWACQPKADHQALHQQIETQYAKAIADAYLIQEKPARHQKIAEIRNAMLAQFLVGETPPAELLLKQLFGDIEHKIVRNRILDHAQRIDGRDTKTIRPITIETNVLPRTHGAALFTRGETQAIVVATLGTSRDAQIIDALEGEYRDDFMLHYNFPPFSVGETGPIGAPKRREIGHGRLARRAMQAVLPGKEKFPYVIRVVSEITESNGSSSMATVCGTSLALMDAGVPIACHVAGIAMGLIKEGDRYAVLTDILGDEDHLGDMDFKVAGTKQGVTALQMDIKIDGITREIMTVALEQAKVARMQILEKMYQTVAEPKALSEYAPSIMTIRIPVDKIRDVIGKGGATIRGLTEETGATIDIADDGFVQIFAVDKKSGEEARRRIELLTAEIISGNVYHGKVVKIVDFGAFVSLIPGKEGLLHISQIVNRRLESVTEVLSEGQEVTVKVLEIDRQGRVRLSMKDVVAETE